MRVAVLTVSDAGARGERADSSGEVAERWARGVGAVSVERALVADETVAVVQRLLAWCDGGTIDLVLTTGGTGLGARDVTPEATRAILERAADGLAERLRGETAEGEPRSALGRGVAGVRGRTLVVNLPGSPRAVGETLAVLAPLVRHAVDILRGAATDHSGGAGGSG